MFIRTRRVLLVLLLTGYCLAGAARAAEPPKPLKVLLITGGCCHDYATQKDLLKTGLEARARVEIVQAHSDDSSTMARFEIYKRPDWAKGYDAVIHDECTSDVKDLPYVHNILKAHKEGIPAVNLHCAMHCHRTGNDDWFEFVGIQSSAHGPQQPIAVNFLEGDHPIIKGLKNWTTVNEELYNNLRVFDKSQALARGKQGQSDYVVAWVNQYGKTRVFSTTLGHNNETVGDPRYLDLVARGLLWSCGKLNDDYLKKP